MKQFALVPMATLDHLKYHAHCVSYFKKVISVIFFSIKKVISVISMSNEVVCICMYLHKTAYSWRIIYDYLWKLQHVKVIGWWINRSLTKGIHYNVKKFPLVSLQSKNHQIICSANYHSISNYIWIELDSK